MKVLYVEDNEQDADLTARRLARVAPAIALATAHTLADARARLAADEAAGALPDVLLVDVRLPDGNGLELLGEVRARGLPIAVVMLTGSGDEALVVTALRSGADDYVVKAGHLHRAPAGHAGGCRRDVPPVVGAPLDAHPRAVRRAERQRRRPAAAPPGALRAARAGGGGVHGAGGAGADCRPRSHRRPGRAAARLQAARHERAGRRARGAPRARPEPAHHRHHRPRRRDERGADAQARRHRLPRQAGRPAAPAAGGHRERVVPRAARARARRAGARARSASARWPSPSATCSGSATRGARSRCT